MTRKIHRQSPQSRLRAPQFGDDEIPAVTGMFAAVDEHEIGQPRGGLRHRWTS
ncbi:hypothetical protein L837_4061 [Mycobacterium avium MAV_061107_1842]|nr:hypothetical protein L837_4061 [Mycobacterium avium MAV_061107_1842]